MAKQQQHAQHCIDKEKPIPDKIHHASGISPTKLSCIGLILNN